MMKFSHKLLFASIGAFFFIITIGFILFPQIIRNQIKGMVNLKPGSDVREMFLKIPFPLDFNVYIFSVENPEDVQHHGAIPSLKEIGPFCYEEWKTKIDVEDIEGSDSMSYKPVDTFIEAFRDNCVNSNTEVTIAHPLILGMANTVARQKPGALNLMNKAFKNIWPNLNSLFIRVKAKDLLFDGIVINCGVQDFAGKAICSQLKAEESIKQLNENDLAFSFLGPKNGTPGKIFEVYRGTQDYHNVGKIITYDNKIQVDIWNSSKCDAIHGTDGTIFPPFLKQEQGLASFAPDLCRSLVATHVKKSKYDGIPVDYYAASLFDPENRPDENCFCFSPTSCTRRGVMDLYKCTQIPIFASQPHFYDSDEIYLEGVNGLNPDMEKHGIRILFESMSGSPVSARKRLQFSMPLEILPKLALFQNFSTTILPLFWVEEAVDLNNTYTKPLKSLFMVKKIVLVINIIVLIVSLGGMAVGGYLQFKQEESLDVISVQKVHPDDDPDVDKRSSIIGLNGRLNGSYQKKY